MTLAKTKKLRKLRRQMMKMFECDIATAYTHTTNCAIQEISISDIEKAINILRNQMEDKQRWLYNPLYYYKVFNDKYPFILSNNATS